MAQDIRTRHGWYRETRLWGIKDRLYCGDSDDRWTELTGDPAQADIETEIAEALDAPDPTTRFDHSVVI